MNCERTVCEDDLPLEHDVHSRRTEIHLPPSERRGRYAAVDAQAPTEVIVRPGSLGGVRRAVEPSKPIERETWICCGFVGFALVVLLLVYVDVPWRLGQLSAQFL